VRVCANPSCEVSLEGRRADSRTCSSKCRTVLWRVRAASEAASAARESSKPSVTVRDPLVTPPAFVGGPCPDSNRCRYYMRFPSGPWTCDYCHPRVRGE
jgi:hypothetical protein